MTTTPQGARRAPRLDWWAVAVGAAVLVPLLKLWGAPLGEPVADDYDFLHRALLEPARLLDGGGALIYWRPLARQLYFAAAGQLMLSHPLLVALLHAALLAASAVLLQRALAPSWGGMRAAAVASFPVLADSARTLILWPSAMQDLGALFFVSLAFHETSRRRPSIALFAIFAALLCKELAVIPILLLPWTPEPPVWKRDRKRWIIAIGVVVAAWAALYAMLLRLGGVMVQGQFESGRPAIAARFLWALGSSLADGFNLRSVPPAIIGVAGLALIVLALIARVRSWRPTAWLLWGALWFVLCTATLAETWPTWGSFRSTLGMAGLGIACVAVLASARPVWLAALVGARLALLLAAPSIPSRITVAPPGDGSGFDVVTISRLQHFARETRATLRQVTGALPQDAVVVWLHRPLMTERAFAHSKALQVWYRDTTVAWAEGVSLDQVTRPIGAALEYHADSPRQIVPVSTSALEQLRASFHAMRGEQFHTALTALARADSLQSDRTAGVFLSQVAGKEALCWLMLDQTEPAERAARRGLALWKQGSDARYAMAALLAGEGKREQAIAQLDTLLGYYPFDQPAHAFRDTLSAGEP
jgi:tetratricopeptide (TPR) repeat protein